MAKCIPMGKVTEDTAAANVRKPITFVLFIYKFGN